MKAALIITAMLAVDAAAIVWVRNGFRSSRAAWQTIRHNVLRAEGGYHRDDDGRGR